MHHALREMENREEVLRKIRHTDTTSALISEIFDKTRKIYYVVIDKKKKTYIALGIKEYNCDDLIGYG